MKRILVIGAGFLQDFVIRKAKSMGYYTLAVDADPDAVGFSHADDHAVINIVDEKACLDYACAQKIDGVLTAATDYGVLTAAYIAREMGLPGLRYETAQLIKNKYRVRKCLFENHVDDTQQAFEVNSGTDFEALKGKLVYPVMVKPCDGSGSRGASRVDGPEQPGGGLPLCHGRIHYPPGGDRIFHYGAGVRRRELSRERRNPCVGNYEKMDDGAALLRRAWPRHPLRTA